MVDPEFMHQVALERFGGNPFTIDEFVKALEELDYSPHPEWVKTFLEIGYDEGWAVKYRDGEYVVWR